MKRGALTAHAYPGCRLRQVVSNEGAGESPFAKLFSWEGTKDYGAFLSLTAAKEWRQALGESDILGYLADQVTLFPKGCCCLRGRFTARLMCHRACRDRASPGLCGR